MKEMECEICGRKGAKFLIDIEGSKMKVCEECSKLGKILSIEREETEKVKRIKERAALRKEEKEIVIVDDYTEVIKKGREKANLTRKELGALVNEKESFLRRIEEGKTIPTEKLAKKLEKALEIDLFEEINSDLTSAKQSKRKETELTFGDLADLKSKRKKND